MAIFTRPARGSLGERRPLWIRLGARADKTQRHLCLWERSGAFNLDTACGPHSLITLKVMRLGRDSACTVWKQDFCHTPAVRKGRSATLLLPIPTPSPPPPCPPLCLSPVNQMFGLGVLTPALKALPNSRHWEPQGSPHRASKMQPLQGHPEKLSVSRKERWGRVRALGRIPE